MFIRRIGCITMDLLVQYTQHGAIQPLTDSVWSSLPTGGAVEELKYIDHVTSICLYLFLVTRLPVCVCVSTVWSLWLSATHVISLVLQLVCPHLLQSPFLVSCRSLFEGSPLKQRYSGSWTLSFEISFVVIQMADVFLLLLPARGGQSI